MEKEIIEFHGGCNGCTQQLTNDIDNCALCQYFDADWSLPNLNNKEDSGAQKARMEIKARLMEKKYNSKNWVYKLFNRI